MQTETVAEDLLTFEDDYVRAGSGKRLANYWIDSILSGILYVIFGLVFTTILPSLTDIFKDPNGRYRFIDFVFSTLFYALFMGSVEAVSKGKSIGKLITKTRAVNLDGSLISNKTAFQRGFARAVPLCVFSGLRSPCNPWQDRWTNTMVIIEKS